jgi:teichoic acid transport system permease protein
MAGIFAYYFISGAVRDGTKSVTSGGRLILNTAFPRVLLPFTSVIIAFYRFLPTIAIYAPVHAFSHLPVNLATLWLLPLTGLMIVLASGLAMVVAALQVYFRDLKSFMPYLLRVWLYISPVLYFAKDMPQGYRWLLDANPLGQLLAAWDDVLHYGQAPGLTSLLVASAWAFGLFVVGGLFFISREREFAVRL